jgi:DNA polymerase-3 subunit beta
VATKSTLPILGNVLLDAAGEALTVSANNLDIGISCVIPARVVQPGRVTLQARLLNEFVASLDHGDVEFVQDQNPLTTTVRHARGQSHMRGIDPEDFPPIPDRVEGSAVLVFDPAALREAISHVAFAAASDDSRPVLAGVHLDAHESTVMMSAADGFRMSLRQLMTVTPVAEPLSIIVPARSLGELSRVVADADEPIEVWVTPNRSQLLANAPGIRFVSRLIDGTFPDLKQVVPKQWFTRTVVPREELLDATRRAAIFARSANDVVRIEFAPASADLDMGRVTIKANAADTGDNQDEVDAQVEGDEMQVAFNGRYLSEVLSVMRGAKVAVELQGPNSAGVIRSVESDDFTHVIMPMVIGAN